MEEISLINQRISYWENKDFYDAVHRKTEVLYSEEKKAGWKKNIVGICKIEDLLSLEGHYFKKIRNEFSKYQKRNIFMKRIEKEDINEIKKVNDGWNSNKRHFMTWKGQGSRFIENNFLKYPCFIFYENKKPVGYNAFFIQEDTLVWAVSKTIDGENGLGTYMLLKCLKCLKEHLNSSITFLNLTSYGSQAKFKRKFCPFFETEFYTKKIKREVPKNEIDL